MTDDEYPPLEEPQTGTGPNDSDSDGSTHILDTGASTRGTGPKILGSLKGKATGLINRLKLGRTRSIEQDPAFGPGSSEPGEPGEQDGHRSPPPSDGPTAHFPRESTLTSIRRMELLSLVEWASQGLQSRGYVIYGKLFTIVLCTWFLADVFAIMAGRYIPEPPPARPHGFGNVQRAKSIEDYNAIFTRNLFNSKGIIPGEEIPGGGPLNPGGEPIKTTLPFNLIGTLILRDEMRSIATIEDKSASMVYPVRVDEEIPSKARILKIEPRRVIFVNTQSNRKEFVELPEDFVSNAKISVATGGAKGPGIEQVGNNQFNISRSEVDKALADFNKILTEARAVPNFENGVPAGYKLFQIVPGSIYDKLGLKNGDTIAGVDGQPINDPAKAFELLGKLKEGASHLELSVKKPDGRTVTQTYDIH